MSSNISVIAAIIAGIVRRSVITVLFVIAVGGMLATNTVGFLHDTVTLQEVIRAIGGSILLTGFFFAFVHPQADQVPAPVPTILGFVGVTVALLGHLLAVDHPYVPTGLKIIVALWALTVVCLWAWYGVIYLDGYEERVENVAEIVGSAVEAARDTVEDIRSDR